MSSQSYTKTYEVIWADIDPNRHMRHSVYNDYAAQTRVALFKDYGIPITKIAAMGLGPILFKEETKFFKEIGLSEQITVSCQLAAMRKDGTHWSFIHKIYNENGDEAAQITVDGAWLNLEKRKLDTPPKELLEITMQFSRTQTFVWMDS